MNQNHLWTPACSAGQISPYFQTLLFVDVIYSLMPYLSYTGWIQYLISLLSMCFKPCISEYLFPMWCHIKDFTIYAHRLDLQCFYIYVSTKAILFNDTAVCGHTCVSLPSYPELSNEWRWGLKEPYTNPVYEKMAWSLGKQPHTIMDVKFMFIWKILDIVETWYFHSCHCLFHYDAFIMYISCVT